MSKKKYVYYFGDGKADGTGQMKDLLGGKGAGLANMVNLKFPVPSGFTITTEACNTYFDDKRKHPAGMWDQVLANLKKVEKSMGAKLGDAKNPLLLSVRSGSKFSMPGMMDTVLNLGLNDTTLKALAQKTGNERFALDTYRRLITMFGSTVMGVDRTVFEKALEAMKKKKGVVEDTELDVDDLRVLVDKFLVIYKKETGKVFPKDPLQQLKLAINAVFDSWFGDRAVTYRNLNHIDHDLGTGCNVQAMVFGNMGDNSGTGVGFTRDPSTGKKKFFAEYLINAQGEDVVAGIRTPLHINEMKKMVPAAYKELDRIYNKLEKHYKDMQDIEFTVQDGKLYMLQTRVGKRTAAASLKIAIDMVKEGVIDKKTAVMRIDPEQIEQLMHPRIDPKFKYNAIAKGLPASPGAAVGTVVFSAEDAEKAAAKGEKVVLVRPETSPEDIGGMDAAQGILTARGGMTSHAAVVARGMGKCCVAGCTAVNIDEKKKNFWVGSKTVRDGDIITLNGTTGEVILGAVPLIQAEMSGDFNTIMKWADEFREMGIRANADTVVDAKAALKFGAEGIGLVRTEHMFFEGDRIKAVREMILSDDEAGRRAALKKILPMQRSDFVGIFKVMKGKPVTIRLLDPPLHEFLPKTDAELREIASDLGVSFKKIHARNDALHEFNPMLGHRGCRLAITYPEIYEMQVQAIIEAACQVAKKGIKALPEIMIPLIADVKEFTILKEMTVRIATAIEKKYKTKIQYDVGTMIEIARAAFLAHEVAPEADFYSFGTNDLTQTLFGLSRDDAGRFLPYYVEQGIFEVDPFMSIDKKGVGALMRMAIDNSRKIKKGMKMGICGEQLDPDSVEFCDEIGLTYVSGSPFRLPVARLAAAQATLKKKGKKGRTSMA
ncbi:MAG: pyruvate, phosphate dikinase [bacterium]|nr:pyruvate, phosphate dikinase [bacterium]MDT8366247.1 pyruvate, phosphate dikinase [bacterium]